MSNAAFPKLGAPMFDLPVAKRKSALPKLPVATTRRSVRSAVATGDQAVLRLSAQQAPRGPAPLQAKLQVGAVNDPLEQEADRIADQVLRMPAAAISGAAAPAQISRRCEECEEENLQREPATRNAATREAPAAVHQVVRSLGQPLDPASRAYFEPRFGHDFGRVRVHEGAAAEQSARAVNAKAYTVGQHIVFAAGQFAPGTQAGRRLLAHELAHVLQQRTEPPSVQRQPEPKEQGPERAHGKVTMHFDGRELMVYQDGAEVFRWSAQSGRPVPLEPKDVAACGADPVTETYLNNPRFVGITDFGPIPEATYQFGAAGIQRFSEEEEHELRWKPHKFVLQTAFGGVEGGDWGNGRVQLRPISPRKEGKCGNAGKRDGFYLHGGVLAGSSGCLDIGDRHFAELAAWLKGYPRPITLTVKYEHPAPAVGAVTGFSGMLAYGRQRRSFQPRLAFGQETTAGGETRKVASGTADIVWQWVGGAAALGLRLDVSLNDKETFVRGGLSGETNFRLFRALYGRLSLGYMTPLSGPGATGGLEVGGGLEYDFGRVQLEAIYDVIAPMSDDNRTRQILFGIGIRR